MEDVVVMLPKSMRFSGGSSDFASGGEEKGMNIFVAHNVPAREQMAFSVSGTGQIPRDAQEGDAGDGQAASGGASDNRPGGGLVVELRLPAIAQPAGAIPQEYVLSSPKSS